MQLFIYICGLVLLLVTQCDVRNISCPELSEKALKAILGTTYNGRYMRIAPPLEETGLGGIKRASGYDDQEFYPDEHIEEENPYAGIPAWEVDHIEIGKNRQKRSATTPPKKRNARQALIDKMTKSKKQDIFQNRPWDCKAEIQWMDLGADYFPRFVRTVQCRKKNCWYGHYTCKPKLFSIKVLRRSTGQCAKLNQKIRLITSIMDEVIGEYAEQWEFVEKAITVCCDCAMDY